MRAGPARGQAVRPQHHQHTLDTQARIPNIPCSTLLESAACCVRALRKGKRCAHSASGTHP